MQSLTTHSSVMKTHLECCRYDMWNGSLMLPQDVSTLVECLDLRRAADTNLSGTDDAKLVKCIKVSPF